MIIPTAEPFFFPGNRTGCLLVHGFTGAPKEMRWMGEYLHDQGYTVLGIRLAGHATRIEDMTRMHWQDWLLNVEDGYCLLKDYVDEIFIIGLSMGGILSLLFASQHPVAGVITLSSPFQLPDDPRLPFAKILAPVMTKVDKGAPDWHDPEAAKDHVEYPYFPVKGIIQLRDLLAEMRAALPKVMAPALIIHSREDGSVNSTNPENILAALGSPDKQIFWVKNSGHVITREPDRFLAFAKASEFISRVSNKQSNL